MDRLRKIENDNKKYIQFLISLVEIKHGVNLLKSTESHRADLCVV